MITLSTLDQKEANFGYFDSLTNISSHFIPKPYSRNQIQGMQGLIPAMVALGKFVWKMQKKSGIMKSWVYAMLIFLLDDLLINIRIRIAKF